ncbi:MAG: hypothetical protein EZS28_024216 [Streblomastix strix]|uniref:Uncharacterized protein n=1 Tax=Streblomastix strix TaxID=222440 RepID=A0A5J4VCG6_9EUKA|nr:MAG: hypothetical protein EZS28_024216 [Streblomastix strix]
MAVALTYFDGELKDRNIREQVENLIAEEAAKFDFPGIGSSEENEFQNASRTSNDIQSSRTSESAISKKVELDEPVISEDNKSDPDALLRIRSRYQIFVENEHNRLVNLFLYSKYGQPKIESEIQALEGKLNLKEKELSDLESEITQINRQRKTDHTKTGVQLEQEKTEIYQKFRSNLYLAQQCDKLEAELSRLESLASQRGIEVDYDDDIDPQ